MHSNDSRLNQNNVERVAYSLWEERGRPAGSPEEDWYRAEQVVATVQDELPVSTAAPLVSGK